MPGGQLRLRATSERRKARSCMDVGYWIEVGELASLDEMKVAAVVMTDPWIVYLQAGIPPETTNGTCACSCTTRKKRTRSTSGRICSRTALGSASSSQRGSTPTSRSSYEIPRTSRLGQVLDLHRDPPPNSGTPTACAKPRVNHNAERGRAGISSPDEIARRIREALAGPIVGQFPRLRVPQSLRSPRERRKECRGEHNCTPRRIGSLGEGP